MRKNIKYTAILLALAVTASCNKIVETPDGDEMIRFAPEAIGTKAMINDEAGLQTQTFDVIDVVDNTELFIDNTVAHGENGWVYTRPADAKYLWKNGAHKLFGYTAGMGTFSGTTLTLPSTTLTTDYSQKDLLYSDIVSTTADAWKTSGKAKGDPVPLHFHHLLSAISLSIENLTGADLTINSVSLNLPVTGTPTISFAGTAPAVNIGTLTPGEFISGTYPATVLASEAKLDALSKVVLTDGGKPAQFMVWPCTFTEGGVTAVVSYTLVDGESSETFEKTVKLPAATWNAGEVLGYNLLVYPEQLVITFEVKDWEAYDFSLDTSTGSINMSNVTWANTKVKLTETGDEVNTVNNSAYSVNMYYKPYVKNGETWSQYTANNGYYPAQGYFTVNYPKTGLFKIGLIPAYGKTEVDESKYEIYIYDYPTDTEEGGFRAIDPDGEPISNNTVYFQVRAAANQDGAEHKAQVNIWFKGTGADDEWVSAYSEVRANYALTIPATN